MYCARLRRAEASRADAHCVVGRESRVPPSQHFLDEGRRDQAFPAQQGKHFRPEPWLEHFARNGRQHGESAVGIESTVRRKHVDMPVEVDEIAECLDEEDHPRSRAGPGWRGCRRALAKPCCGSPHSRNRSMTLSSTRRPNRPPAFNSGACRVAH
jgi:hypothetical protein